MKKVKVALKKKVDNSYEVLIGSGVLKNLLKDLKKKPLGNKYVIITDATVKKKYGNKILQQFAKNKLNAIMLSFPAGEKSKNRSTVVKLHDAMIATGCGRDTCVIALGGGVVGDVAGFVAATLCRGVNYVQVPTTLLAMVDSSVGGKVGVDTKDAKNIIGAFHQPKKVVADINFLKTLPKKELQRGLAEVIKHAIIADVKLFSYLHEHMGKILNKNLHVLEQVIQKNCKIKAQVVQKDEKESGMRKNLNFGHTIGHAIESVTNYRVPHGEAIAIGMVAETKIAQKKGMITKKQYQAITDILEKAKLPIKLPKNSPILQIIKATRKDKKARGGIPEYVLPTGIGKVKHGVKVSDKIVQKVLEGLK